MLWAGKCFQSSRQPTVSPFQWAKRLFGCASLGDKRRTCRLVEVAASLAAQPSRRICSSFRKWKSIKAGYRLIENEKVTAEQLLAPSTQAAVAAGRGQERVLAVGDTTTLNFTSHRATSGLGTIAEGYVQGLLAHNTILLREDGLPLGLLDQEIWTRDPEEYGKRSQRKRKALEEKESYRWIETVERVSGAFDDLEEEERPNVVYVFDREGDIHETYQTIEDAGDGCVIRSCQNRKVTDPYHPSMHASVMASEPLERRTLDIPRKHGETKRKAEVEVRACTVILNPTSTKKGRRRPLQVNVVAVTEVDPPETVKEPVRWILVTTLAIDTLEEVWEVVRIYKLRWRIEDFHLVLKSGCGVEKLQFETAERLIKMVAILSAIALRLLVLTHRARLEPDLPCTEILEEDEWRALVTAIQGAPPSPKARPPTLKQAVLWIGKLGGHVGRKSDGMPGVRLLWRGWRDLQVATAVFQACATDTQPLA